MSREAVIARYGADGESSLRVLVLTAEVGEGHAAAARALAEDLVRERAEVEVVVCDALVGLGPALRWFLLDAYRWQLRAFPWLFGILYGSLARVGPLRRMSLRGCGRLGARSLRRLIERHDPDVVVSTYPAATVALGHLRRVGRVEVPACATVTDLAGVEFWVHPGIDLHLVMDASCVGPAERVAGCGTARCVGPLVSASFFAPLSRAGVRHKLGLPLDAPLVLVSGGGWGVGDLAGAVRACLALAGAHVVCLAGRNEEARRGLAGVFADEDRVRVLGFTDQMNELLAAADVLVHSTGGVTCLEALVRGCPIVAYGAPPGHARRTAHVMHSLGLLEAVDSQPDLVGAVGRAVAKPDSERPRLAAAPRASTLVLSAKARPRPMPSRGERVLRPLTTVGMTVVLAAAMLMWDDAYPVVARALDISPVASVSTDRPEVGLVLRARNNEVADLVGVLERRDAHASFAFPNAPAGATLRMLARAGEQPMAEIGPGHLTRWLDTKDELRRDTGTLDKAARHIYLAPNGLTLGQYLLAREIGDTPVSGSVHVGPEIGRLGALDAGDVIVATLSSRASGSATELERLLAQIRQHRLTAVSLPTLLDHPR